MQHFTADCLILRAVDRGDHDKLLTVLAANYGKFYAILKGAHSMHRREAAAAEPFTWSNIEFYEKGGVKWVKTATAIETFPGLRYDMEKLFLAAYFCEVAGELSDEREPAGEILPLTLNALHMLNMHRGENARVKGAFEMRAACIGGFAPELACCRDCGCPADRDGYLDVMNGAFVCRACLQRRSALHPIPEVDELGERTVLSPLSPGGAAALRYVSTAPAKRVFSFRVTSEREEREFSKAAESYLLHHLERSFPTLENLKKLDAIMRQREQAPFAD
ncbi:MAG: DNA repair protein RecO [Ruminococcaceae bacterium]|nr:DNA repair protein RecO [Oscillospiraceae bacterium]